MATSLPLLPLPQEEKSKPVLQKYLQMPLYPCSTVFLVWVSFWCCLIRGWLVAVHGQGNAQRRPRRQNAFEYPSSSWEKLGTKNQAKNNITEHKWFDQVSKEVAWIFEILRLWSLLRFALLVANSLPAPGSDPKENCRKKAVEPRCIWKRKKKKTVEQGQRSIGWN